MPRSADVTRIVERAATGDAGAARELVPLVYDELLALARSLMRRERADHTLQATALVHEVYVRLVDEQSLDWSGRAHFIAIAARVMRRILVDHARRHRAEKRGGHRQRVELNDNSSPATEKSHDLLDLDDALNELAAIDAREADVVVLRYFGGLTVDETAAVLGVSPRTVKNDWSMARVWLLDRMSEEPSAP